MSGYTRLGVYCFIPETTAVFSRELFIYHSVEKLSVFEGRFLYCR